MATQPAMFSSWKKDFGVHFPPARMLIRPGWFFILASSMP
jgi:hypothetical protein